MSCDARSMNEKKRWPIRSDAASAQLEQTEYEQLDRAQDVRVKPPGPAQPAQLSTLGPSGSQWSAIRQADEITSQLSWGLDGHHMKPQVGSLVKFCSF